MSAATSIVLTDDERPRNVKRGNEMTTNVQTSTILSKKPKICTEWIVIKYVFMLAVWARRFKNRLSLIKLQNNFLTKSCEKQFIAIHYTTKKCAWLYIENWEASKTNRGAFYVWMKSRWKLKIRLKVEKVTKTNWNIIKVNWRLTRQWMSSFLLFKTSYTPIYVQENLIERRIVFIGYEDIYAVFSPFRSEFG